MYELGTQLQVVKSIVPSIWYNAPVKLAFIRDILSTRNRAFSSRGPQIGFSDLEMDRHICRHHGFILKKLSSLALHYPSSVQSLGRFRRKSKYRAGTKRPMAHPLTMVRSPCLRSWTELVIKKLFRTVQKYKLVLSMSVSFIIDYMATSIFFLQYNFITMLNRNVIAHE